MSALVHGPKPFTLVEEAFAKLKRVALKHDADHGAMKGGRTENHMLGFNFKTAQDFQNWRNDFARAQKELGITPLTAVD